MYRTKKPTENLDHTVYMPYADAYRTINRYSVGRQIYLCCDVPLPVMGKEETNYLPGYVHCPLTRAQAKKVVDGLMRNYSERPEPPVLKIHVYGGCVFIGGHYSTPKTTQP